MTNEPLAPSDDFPMAALLRTVEENVRQVAERLEERGVLADDSETKVQLANVRIWLMFAARRTPE